VSRTRIGAQVVAVIDWRAAATLKDNTVLCRRAGLLEKSRSRRRPSPQGPRALLVRADGSCELQRFTAATVARRLRGAADANGKTGTGRRG
jgi:hypothetical protein